MWPFARRWAIVYTTPKDARPVRAEIHSFYRRREAAWNARVLTELSWGGLQFKIVDLKNRKVL